MIPFIVIMDGFYVTGINSIVISRRVLTRVWNEIPFIVIMDGFYVTGIDSIITMDGFYVIMSDRLHVLLCILDLEVE